MAVAKAHSRALNPMNDSIDDCVTRFPWTLTAHIYRTQYTNVNNCVRGMVFVSISQNDNVAYGLPHRMLTIRTTGCYRRQFEKQTGRK